MLSEFLGFAARRALRSAAAAFVRELRASREAEIVPATPQDWDGGFALFRARPDKEWSLVDRISINLCEARGIRRVFTADRHFAQAGLEILLD